VFGEDGGVVGDAGAGDGEWSSGWETDGTY
jgi:hypothetical protein